MPRIRYKSINFQGKSLEIITKANEIARDYASQGYDLTLRQLYYRFVANGWIPNKQSEYKRLGSIINDARMAGLMDWSYITDRTRNVRGGDGSMTDPEQVINEYAYAMALWQGQTERVEVWVEKDALVGVIGQAAGRIRTPYFSCRGYTSQSEVWEAARRIEGYLDEPGVKHVTVLHLGDHDPSGIDMTRDIDDRLYTFVAGDGYNPGRLSINRIALNMDQVEQYDPPPNPAKDTDSRFGGYADKFGDESWELDALEPRVLDTLIRSNINALIDKPTWDERVKLQGEGRATLLAVRTYYDEVIDFLRGNDWLPEAVIDDDDTLTDDEE